MHATTTPASGTSPIRRGRNLRWRVVDIVVASVIGVGSGVIFWAWGIAYSPLSAPLAATPGLNGLLNGGWLFAAVLGGLIIRKPGAAVYTEVVAAFVSALIGTQWASFEVLLWGAGEALGAEIVFAIFLYRRWNIGVAALAGIGAGFAVGFMDVTLSSSAALDTTAKTIHLVSSAVSGLVIAGLLSWFAARGLAATGALSRFAAGREARPVSGTAPGR